MSAKPDGATFDTIVAEALARMKDATSASPSYQVDRRSGQWIVRRAPTTGALIAADVMAEAMASKTAE